MSASGSDQLYTASRESVLGSHISDVGSIPIARSSN